MKQALLALTVALCAGCGADTTTTAATAAAVKKQEVEQGKKTVDQLRQRIGAAAEQMRESARASGEAAEENQLNNE
ncbi:MAG: hypothetical protein ACJ8LN_14865 [Sulfurifustis sp.]